ncbi:MAG: hypothetical protein C0518_11600 [Opitutus sp.]|nr:hypothetical protein [Opitutus sp.]
MPFARRAKPPRPSLGRVTEWVLGRFTQLPGNGRGAALGITCLLGVIGWVDYITGTRMSFVVFYLIPVSVAVTRMGRGAGVLAALASVVIRFVADSNDRDASLHDAWLWWNSVGSLLVYFVVVWILDALIKFHRQLEDRVRERTNELEAEVRKRQEIQRQLLDLSASERSAMGRELHDQLGQHLVGTAMAAQVLAQRLHARDENGGREARKIAELLEQGVAQTRQLAHGLLLTQLEPARLGAEFEELCATLRQQYPRVVCECRIETRRAPADAGAAAQLFRIGQEALRNAFRHSAARTVTLVLADDGHGLLLSVADDGCGLPAAGAGGSGMGLSIMQHRAEHLGTRLQIESTPGCGTCIKCFVPATPVAAPKP